VQINSRVRPVALGARVVLILVLAIPAIARAQVLRVSGRVVDETGTTPIRGVVVRLTGSDTTMTTGESGTFSFSGVIPGRLVLTASAPDRQFYSTPLELTSDTVLTIVMRRPRVVTLDTVRVRPGDLRIKGSARDSASGDYIWFAQAALYPEGRFVGASDGEFSFDKVNRGPVTIVVEAPEHLPRVVQLDLTRDTTIRVLMAVDSLALRMIAAQVTRLTTRSEASPFTTRGYNREDMAREHTGSIGEFIDRMMFKPPDPRRRAAQSADDACVFVDDRRVAPGVIDGILPELIERVEVYARGGMIRVYTKRYVMSLVGQENLPKPMYMPTGFRPTCQ
jgi:hypothetical protein